MQYTGFWINHLKCGKKIMRNIQTGFCCTVLHPSLLTTRFLAAIKQLYEWFSPWVCPSVFPSVTLFSLCSYHCISMKLSGDITDDRSDVHATNQGHRSNVKVTVVKTQFSRFQIEITYDDDIMHTPWWCLGEVLYRFVKVMLKISRSRIKTVDFAQIKRF